jgi:2-keto-4-pentenoate hydratase
MSAKIDEAAARLRQAEETNTPCAPIRDLFAEGDLNAAYAVQAVNRAHWLKTGRQLIGRKVAVSAKAAQKAMGLSEPAYGMLYADMLMGDGDEVAVDRVMQPRLEGEVAVVLERDLVMERPTLVDVLRAVAYVVPAIEVVGCRIAQLDTKAVDLIADNAGSGTFVLGATARKLDGLDLRRMTMTMTKNGEQVASGTGALVAGAPLHALAWLAARMVKDELPLKAGDVVMTGTFFPMLPASPGDRIEVHAEGLGRCEVSFAA